MANTIRHMSVNIQGLLRNYQTKKITFIEDNNGKLLSDKEARLELSRLQELGHKLLATGNCQGFDPLGGGCPGHPIVNKDSHQPIEKVSSSDSETNFEIYHRPLSGEYFRGSIKKWDGKYIVTCQVASGGNETYSVLDILDFSNNNKADLINQIQDFAKKHKFIFKVIKKSSTK